MRPDENGLPIHGLCCGLPDWEVVSTDATTTRGQAPAGSTTSELAARLPVPARPRRMSVSVEPAALHVDTTLRPTGDTPVPVSFGYHPYLTLPGVPRADFQIELPGVRARGILDERSIPTGATEPAPSRPARSAIAVYDDFFPELTEPPEFRPAGGGRRIARALRPGLSGVAGLRPAAQRLHLLRADDRAVDALATGDGLTLASDYAARFSITVEGEPGAA